MKYIFILIIFSFQINIFGQIQIDISYGQKLEMPSIHEKSEVFIYNDGKIIYKGNSINEYLFEEPGNFEVKVNEYLDHSKSQCEHKHLPENFIAFVF